MPEGQQRAAGDTILGEGSFRYRVNRDWAKLPDGWSFHEVAAVGVDRNDNVFVFNRGDHPMIVFDRHGNFLRAWVRTYSPTRMASRWHRTIRFIAPTMVIIPFAR